MKKYLCSLFILCFFVTEGYGQVVEYKVSTSKSTNPIDLTSDIQTAITTSDKIIFDNDNTDGSTKTYTLNEITLKSDLIVEIENNVTLEANPSFFRDNILRFINIVDFDNVDIIGGTDSKIIMDKALMTSDQQRHCIYILRSNHINIKKIELEESGGDGVYIGVDYSDNGSDNYCEDITVEEVIFRRHARNGLSIISGKDITINKCKFYHTGVNNNTNLAPGGPWAGIDLEPNDSDEFLKNIEIFNCEFYGNKERGIHFHFEKLNGSNEIIVNIKNPIIKKETEETKRGIEFHYLNNSNIYGTITIENPKIYDVSDIGIAFRGINESNLVIDIQEPVIEDPQLAIGFINLYGVNNTNNITISDAEIKNIKSAIAVKFDETQCTYKDININFKTDQSNAKIYYNSNYFDKVYVSNDSYKEYLAVNPSSSSQVFISNVNIAKKTANIETDFIVYSGSNADILHMESGNLDTDDIDELVYHTGTDWITFRDVNNAMTSATQFDWNDNASDYINHLVVGEFDGTGDDDIACNTGPQSLITFKKTDETVIDNTNFNSSPIKNLISGDFDNDGKDEIACYFNSTNSDIEIFEYWSNTPKYSVTPLGIVDCVLSGDFNNDNYDEILVYDNTNNNLYLYEGNLTSYKTYSVNFDGTNLISGDFNGDGYDDIAICGDTDHSVTIWDFINEDKTENIDVIESSFNYIGNMTAGLFYTPTSIYSKKRNNIEIKEINIASNYKLGYSYPNPFNPTTNIQYSIPENQKVILTVYNSLGHTIETLVNENQSAGNYNIIWNASNQPSGIYFYRLVAGSFIKTRKCILIK